MRRWRRNRPSERTGNRELSTLRSFSLDETAFISDEERSGRRLCGLHPGWIFCCPFRPFSSACPDLLAVIVHSSTFSVNCVAASGVRNAVEMHTMMRPTIAILDGHAASIGFSNPKNAYQSLASLLAAGMSFSQVTCRLEDLKYHDRTT